MTAPLKIRKHRLLARPPRTAMEVYELLPDSTRSEVIDNTLYMPPTPSTEHQETIFRVGFAIYPVILEKDLGKFYPAPLSVYLSNEVVVEPDLIFIRSERLNIIQNGKIRGIPDLLIELLSPGNLNHDLVRKFELYQQFGVPEYIIIDPLTKEVIQYVLQEGTYQKQASQNGSFYSQVLQASFSF